MCDAGPAARRTGSDDGVARPTWAVRGLCRSASLFRGQALRWDSDDSSGARRPGALDPSHQSHMTDLLSDIETPSDAELISRVRGGDTAAYGDLFSRHVQAANRLAKQLIRGPDADDLVSEAFAKVLTVLQAGGGPDVAFRAYLLTSVRRLHVDRVRSQAKLQTTGDLT